MVSRWPFHAVSGPRAQGTPRAATAGVDRQGLLAIGAHEVGRVVSQGLPLGDNDDVQRGTGRRASIMPRILRVNNPDGEPIGTTESAEGVRAILEPLPPRRYHIDEISRDPLPSGHTSHRWGPGIKRGGWTVTINRDP